MSYKTKSFCVYPWIHQYANPAGKAGLCCIADSHGNITEANKEFDLAKTGFGPAWNANSLREIRRKMIAGEKISACQTCDFQESIQKKSYRQGANQEWTSRIGSEKLEQWIRSSEANDYRVEGKPIYLDLRLGNLCNLKCRMCNPTNSILIEKEWKSLDQESHGEHSRFMADYGFSCYDSSAWYNSKLFWNSCKDLIPTLQKIYLTGGEPTLIKKNSEFLRECIRQKRAGEIVLNFNVNGTNMDDDFIELIAGFKWVNIFFSFDALGELGEYIRFPSHWPRVEANFRKLLSANKKNISIGISPVVQAYNLLAMPELFKWIESCELEYHQEIHVDLLYCEDPKFLSVEVLPQFIRQEAIGRLEKYKAESPSFISKNKIFNKGFLVNGVESLIRYLQNPVLPNQKTLLADFLKYTKVLDRKRNQNFASSCTELSRLLGPTADFNFVSGAQL